MKLVIICISLSLCFRWHPKPQKGGGGGLTAEKVLVHQHQVLLLLAGGLDVTVADRALKVEDLGHAPLVEEVLHDQEDMLLGRVGDRVLVAHLVDAQDLGQAGGSLSAGEGRREGVDAERQTLY